MPGSPTRTRAPLRPSRTPASRSSSSRSSAARPSTSRGVSPPSARRSACWYPGPFTHGPSPLEIHAGHRMPTGATLLSAGCAGQGQGGETGHDGRVQPTDSGKDDERSGEPPDDARHDGPGPREPPPARPAGRAPGVLAAVLVSLARWVLRLLLPAAG